MQITKAQVAQLVELLSADPASETVSMPRQLVEMLSTSGDDAVPIPRLQLGQLFELLSAVRVYIIGQLERCKVRPNAPTP